MNDSTRATSLHRMVSHFYSAGAAILFLSTLVSGDQLHANEPLPAVARAFLSTHCLDCHGRDEPEAELNLDLPAVVWQDGESTAMWERVYNALEKREMPPAEEEQPTDEARKEMVAWLYDQLMQHSPVGGRVPRRLNRDEYEHTIRDLFDMPEFRVPESFPADDEFHGFDNVGEGLILSPPLMAQFIQLASQVAEEVIPPDVGPSVADRKQYVVRGIDFESGAGVSVEGDRVRLASSKNQADSAGWPTRFEAPQSGVYRVTVHTTPFQTEKMFYARRSTPFRVGIYARQKTKQTYDPLNDLRKLVEFEISPNGDSPAFTCEIELVKGEEFGLRWEDGPLYSDPDSRQYSSKFIADRLTRDRRLYAALLKFGRDKRGTSPAEYYESIVALMSSGELDLSDPRLDKVPENKRVGGFGGTFVRVDLFSHEELRRYGPAIDITRVNVEGPLQLIEDDESRARKSRTERLLGGRVTGASDREYAELVLHRFLPRAFRRPVSAAQVRAYVDLAMRHIESDAARRIEDGLHLAVRQALVSPYFLYRSLYPGQLDDFDLASRLSYFLNSSPPDDQLFELARSGELSNPSILRSETLRLLESAHSENFVQRFTGQWLGTRKLQDISPDPRLLLYHVGDDVAMTQETELFFAEILRENHPLETFIDPGFSYRNKKLNRFYGTDLKHTEMQRVEFERGGRHGGVLGLASVMMATANGVDTHPVLRGVWMLENIFGTPIPEPPKNVAAIAPDTSGTTTVREQLEAHLIDKSCARCHKLIDPLGMVLESFDPIGRWRDHYPIFIQPADGEEALKEEFYANVGKGTKDGPPVDSVAVLANGTRLKDVTDLKRYLVENIDIFSRCMAEKLLVYATGRRLSFGDRRVVDQIVLEMKNDGQGFRDLIVEVVLSEAFAVR